MAVSRGGDALALWSMSDAHGDAPGLWCRRYAAKTGRWGEAVALSNDDTSYPHLALDRSGHTMILWSRNGHAMVVRCGAWSDGCGPLLQLDDDAQGGVGLRALAVAPGGDAVALWRKHASDRTELWARRYDAAQDRWAAAERVGTDTPGLTWLSTVLLDPAGRATAIWRQRAPDGSESVWVNRFE